MIHEINPSLSLMLDFNNYRYDSVAPEDVEWDEEDHTKIKLFNGKVIKISDNST